ncbi:hypothetical protein EDD86DRAFT_186547, partial [Gorgonomyces haynaldii]
IQWDEENITRTEAEKDSTMKITEPKTPFIHYNDATDEITGTSNGVPFLELEAALNVATPLSQNSSSENLNKDVEHRLQIAEDWQSDTSMDTDNDQERKKRQKFNKARADHYNMKNVLLHARKLLENEDEIEGYNDPNRFDDDHHDQKDEMESVDSLQ